MIKKLFSGFALILSLLTVMTLISVNMLSKELSALTSVLFIIPGSIAVGSTVFFAAKLFLEQKAQAFFNRLMFIQVIIFTLLSVAAPIVSFSSRAIEWSVIVGAFQVAAQIAFAVLVFNLVTKKPLTKTLSVIIFAFVSAVCVAVTVNSIIALPPELTNINKALEITAVSFKNLQFIVLGAYVVFFNKKTEG